MLIPRGTLVETSHCIAIPACHHEAYTRHTILDHYTFRAGHNDGRHLLALGLGSLFNHSRRPNLDYRLDAPSCIIRYYACR